MALYYFRNTSAGSITINEMVITQNNYYKIYNSDTDECYGIEWLLNSMQNDSNGINKMIFNAELTFYVDAVVKTATEFYTWWNTFILSYTNKKSSTIVIPKIKTAFGITVDGSGSVLTVGNKGTVIAPYSLVITGFNIVTDVAGSLIMDIWKNTSEPSVANSICNSNYITLSSSKTTNVIDPTWTTNVIEGDFITFYINSVTSIKRLTLTIKGMR